MSFNVFYHIMVYQLSQEETWSCLIAFGSRTLRARSLSRLRNGTLKRIIGLCGWNSIWSSISLPPLMDGFILNFIAHSFAIRGTPDEEKNSMIQSFGTDLTHSQVTDKGKRGGRPNSSSTLSPIFKGLLTSFSVEDTFFTEWEDATMRGQFVGVATKEWSYFGEISRMDDFVISCNPVARLNVISMFSFIISYSEGIFRSAYFSTIMPSSFLIVHEEWRRTVNVVKYSLYHIFFISPPPTSDETKPRKKNRKQD